MSHPITSDQDTPLEMRRARIRPVAKTPSLTGARLLRATRRQAIPFAIAVASVTALGVAYDMSGGVRLQAALPLWLGVGVTVALIVAAMRELGRNTVTSIASLGKHRGYAVLGAAPALTPAALRQLPPDARSPLGVMTLQPASAFASAFRNLQDAVANDKVVAMIAPTPEAGATTVALCTAIGATQQGRRVIIVDCDIRRRSLTTALGRDPSVGVLQAAERPETWRSFVEQEDETGLPFLPAAAESNPWRSLFGAPGFPTLLDHLRAEFDLVVLDCPPALRAEAVMLARMADRCVVVAEWDETPLAILRRLMRTLRNRSRAVTGIYVNRVPPGYRFGRVRPE